MTTKANDKFVKLTTTHIDKTILDCFDVILAVTLVLTPNPNPKNIPDITAAATEVNSYKFISNIPSTNINLIYT